MSNKSPDSKIDILMKLPDETNKGGKLYLERRKNKIRSICRTDQLTFGR